MYRGENATSAISWQARKRTVLLAASTNANKCFKKSSTNELQSSACSSSRYAAKADTYFTTLSTLGSFSWTRKTGRRELHKMEKKVSRCSDRHFTSSLMVRRCAVCVCWHSFRVRGTRTSGRSLGWEARYFPDAPWHITSAISIPSPLDKETNLT